MNLTFFSADPGNHKFIEPIAGKLKQLGHETRITNNYSPDSSADIYWFDFVDNNLIVASNEYADDLRSKKVIARLHAVEYYMGHYNKVNWEVVDDLIFVSSHMKRKVGNLPVKTHVVHNGINLDKFTFRKRDWEHPKFNIAYVGNIVPTKGILIMFHYFAQLRRKDARYKLHLVGLNRFHGREGEYYKHYLDICKLKEGVIESGEIENVNEWLNDKYYLWQPSLSESFSIIVGEAMAKGIKPIINNFDGSEELWPKEYIYKNFDEFYQIVLGSYDSASYRDYVKKYSLNKQIKQIDEIIKT